MICFGRHELSRKVFSVRDKTSEGRSGVHMKSIFLIRKEKSYLGSLKRITQWLTIIASLLFILWLLVSYVNIIAINWNGIGEVPTWNCLRVLLRLAGVNA